MQIISPKGRKFSSIQDMEKGVQQDIDNAARKVLESVAREIKQIMQGLIGDFYAEYEPDFYERTGSLMSAVDDAECKVYKTKDGFKMRIVLFNENSMTSKFAPEDKSEYFNSYIDLTGRATYGGKRYTDWVIDWVGDGTDIKCEIMGHDKLHYKEKINKLLDEKVNSGILKELKRAGYNLH